MSSEPTSLGPNWWTALTHGGLLIAPAIVEKAFSDDLQSLPASRAEVLRRALTRRAETGVRTLLDTVFTQVLGYDPGRWNRNPPSEQWSHRLITGDTERPDRLYIAGDGAQSGPVFPIFTEKPDIRIGYHRGRQAVARVVEWLRRSDLKVALLATEQQWRLIYAGSDFEAWCEWNLDLWFESGQPALQVEALLRLLNPASVPGRLLDAIQDSRCGQSELTSVLGERVRQAVEKLIQSTAANLEGLNVLPSDIYLAATRMIMRCVVALFAEGKGMLGRDMPAYHDSYGIQGLREQLERISLGRPEILIEEPHFAWPRLISLFRLIHSGSSHPQLTTTRYGGTLFEPGDHQSSDPVLRAVAAFESTHPCPRDRDVYDMLLLLTRTFVKVSQGRGARAVPTPVDFSNLDTEYIGILYEGLLDYDLKRADEPVVFLRMGDEPALRVSDLEAIPPSKLKDVFGKLQKKSELSVSEGEDGEETDEPDNDLENEDPDAEEPDDMENALTPDAADFESEAAAGDAGIERARKWAIDAVRASGRVRAPRRQYEQARSQYEEEVAKEARNLFSRIVRTGDWYLVRFGNTRKGSGTFYTRKELAGPTVRRTLAPLVRDESGAARTPEEILAVKVCDPAVGSGSFLISALRYITEALYDSLYRHDRFYSSGANRCYKLGVVADECLPDAEDFEDRLRARLRRHVVERCLYGVDLNPLAIELARMSLWIETLDHRLPFGFLDHKLKAGNSLVGCWFDRFEDYPVRAWTREGGDKDYESVNPRANWTKAIKQHWNDRIKPAMARLVEGKVQPTLPGIEDIGPPSEIHDQIRRALREIHDMPVHEADQRRAKYSQLRSTAGFAKLKRAFDVWTAVWFWPADRLDVVPEPSTYLEPSTETEAIASELQSRHGFFHWELEFPDVFTKPRSGFDAVIGNPPWETLQPVSKEFFSNIDPMYRGLGKQDALRRQREIFSGDARHETEWLSYKYFFSAIGNLHKNLSDKSCPSLTRSPRRNLLIRDLWATMTSGRSGYSDPIHPFCHQGEGKVFTYKMFLEVAYRLLRDSGRMGMVVPSGIYSDHGSTALRTLFLESSRWEWLFSFENRDGIFEIHRSFKFNPLILRKGDRTETIRTGFMHHRLQEWEEADKQALDYPSDQVIQFSPASKAFLEIRSERDRLTLQKLYSNGVLLGDQSENGWGIRYAQGDFNMTSDSKLFPARPEWELKGYRADEYGHWLKGSWISYDGQKTILYRERDLVLSADGLSAIRVSDIEDVALPLYQGAMIHQFDWCYSIYRRGGKPWKQVDFEHKRIEPQYLMSASTYLEEEEVLRGTKLAFRDVARSTDERTFLGGLVPDCPCGNTLGVLSSANDTALLVAVVNTFAFEWITRHRLTGTHLNKFVAFELPVLHPDALERPQLQQTIASLSMPNIRFAREWSRLAQIVKSRQPWKQQWALTDFRRESRICAINAIIAKFYGIRAEEIRRMLSDCDYPESLLAEKGFRRTLDPKGFWRVDKGKPPERRQTVLSLIAFDELEQIGLDAFLDLNEGEGWMVPRTLRLADYGLGHDERAKEHQPVASVLGPCFYDWQLSQSVEESWEECERHAELLGKIVPAPPHEEEAPESAVDHGPDGPAVNLFGEPVPTDLFGNPEYSSRSRRRR